VDSPHQGAPGHSHMRTLRQQGQRVRQAHIQGVHRRRQAVLHPLRHQASHAGIRSGEELLRRREAHHARSASSACRRDEGCQRCPSTPRVLPGKRCTQGPSLCTSDHLGGSPIRVLAWPQGTALRAAGDQARSQSGRGLSIPLDLLTRVAAVPDRTDSSDQSREGDDQRRDVLRRPLAHD
jgi:hypothetical protein